MTEQINLVPKRRFKEFQNTSAWEQRKLSKMTVYKNGKGHEDRQSNSGNYELINLNSISIDGGLKHSGKFINDAEDTLLKDDVVMILSDVGHGDLLGRVALIPENNRFVLNQRVALLRPNETANAQFLFSYINSHQYYFKSKGAGMSQLNISKGSVENFESFVPKLEEQRKIGEFFKGLDHLITLHQCKLEKMKALKSAYLSEMFPAEGEREPKRRFAGFTGAWEQRKLGNIIESMYNGQTPSRFKDENWGGNINWLSSGELNCGVVTETIEKITPEGQKDTNLRVVPAGAFVMAITGLEAAGTRGNCAKLAIDTTLNQSCMALFPKKDLLDSNFLFQWYRKVGEEYGIRYTQGTKQRSYNAELINILPITLPKIEEQQKMAALFDVLDHTIALHQRKLEKLQNIKKAYLNEMFV